MEANILVRILEMKSRMTKIALMIDDLENFVKASKASTTDLWPKDFTTKNFLKSDSQLNASAKEFTLSDLAAAAAAADRAAADAVCKKF